MSCVFTTVPYTYTNIYLIRRQQYGPWHYSLIWIIVYIQNQKTDRAERNNMDIEQNENNGHDLPPQSPTKSNNHVYIRQSIKSRLSNESMFSIPQAKNYPEKISLESNISQKLRERQKDRGLFDQLLGGDEVGLFNLNQVRNYGSNPNDYRVSRMSEENSNQQHENPSMEVEQPSSQTGMGNLIVQEKIICKCSKSKCLLMYCECFSKGLVCNKECECYQCRNHSEFEQKRQKARQAVLERDPNAFTNKLQIVGGEQSQLAHKRGCNCKKTHCFKKYCECFHAGVKCTYLCHCQGCLNGGENAYKE